MQEDDTRDGLRKVILMGSDEELTTEMRGHLDNILGGAFQFSSVDQRQYERLLDKRADAEEETAYTRVKRFTSSSLFHAYPPPIVVVFQDAHDWVRHQLPSPPSGQPLNYVFFRPNVRRSFSACFNVWLYTTRCTLWWLATTRPSTTGATN